MSADEIAELQRQNCIFCKIANKEIPAKIIHEDADTMCILDINPASEGHILVYPKKHYMILPHIPDDVLSKIFKNVKLMSQTLLKSLQCKGTTIFVANGMAAGQKAPHALIHVFPRRENDGLVQLPNYEMSDEQIEKLKNELKPYMNQMFGVRRKIIKEAEFVDKKESKEEKVVEDKEEFEEKETEVEKVEVKPTREKHREKVQKTKEDKKDESKKPTPNKEVKPKVDLDDIAKLFGG
jgi:histidine triad (HIT) family protein